MSNENKNGLKRNIPEDIKKEVRNRSGFGCVCCGSIPYTYHHNRIPFSEAKQHDPDDIVLLCDQHHRMFHSGALDAGDIELAVRTKRGVNTPTRYTQPIIKPDFYVKWSGVHVQATQQHVVVDYEPVLSFAFSENPLEPIILSGTFRALDGTVLCQVMRNEFVVDAPVNGDFSHTGNRFVFNRNDNQPALSFTLGSSCMEIDYILHTHKDAFVYGCDGLLRVGNSKHVLGVRGGKCTECNEAIRVQSTMPSHIFNMNVIKKLPYNEISGMNISQCGGAVLVRA
ncbi:HNH endonuclease signature motif containing protein [uncultured Roseibium sp.]|uniref:HNH endonuclease signature motif containing protein n=1 Tax=uncultured Roseibium sp. TaxID=1936171 RepID=UPI003217EF8F